jgi:hypothetical protein
LRLIRKKVPMHLFKRCYPAAISAQKRWSLFSPPFSITGP